MIGPTIANWAQVIVVRGHEPTAPEARVKPERRRTRRERLTGYC